MYRSKIGLITLKKVKWQLSAIYEFVVTVKNGYAPLEDKEVIKKISSKIQTKYRKNVEGFLTSIFWEYEVLKLNKQEQAFVCYKFQEECHWKYLSSRYRYVDAIDEKDKYKPIHQEEFRDLCLRYWGITEKNTMKPNKCKKIKEKTEKKFNKYPCDTEIWEKIKKEPQD